MEGKKSGFTLLHLIIIVIVIAILAGVMIGTFVSVVRSAKEASAKQQAACEAMIKSNEDLIDVIKNKMCIKERNNNFIFIKLIIGN